MKVTDEFKNRFYYHGTYKRSNAQNIQQSGCLIPGRSSYFGEYKPIDGMVYITPDPRIGILYSFGYTTLEEWEGLNMPQSFQNEYGQYICIIDGKNLRDIRPDEDFMAFALHECFVDRYSRENRKYSTPDELDIMTEEHWNNAKSYIDSNNVFNRNDIKKYSRNNCTGLFEFCLKKSKVWISKMTDSETEFWLKTGCSIAHKGNLAIEEMRIINFFDKNIEPTEIINSSEIIYKKTIKTN